MAKRKQPGPHGPVSERIMRHYYGASKGAPSPPDPVKLTLGTMISWMGQSANSPLSRDECERLLKMLDSREGA